MMICHKDMGFMLAKTVFSNKNEFSVTKSQRKLLFYFLLTIIHESYSLPLKFFRLFSIKVFFQLNVENFVFFYTFFAVV